MDKKSQHNGMRKLEFHYYIIQNGLISINSNKSNTFKNVKMRFSTKRIIFQGKRYITIIPWARVGYEVINNQRARSASWL